eukprot:CAMPEP_0170142760 /NCGR_PEP_ID=MMETSP0033_2-20121228/8404_1 /TAXON_ID=195969 /ORGANISM="Dolichomastix tenuilepis, Strain CCMP3274" /LENGTH=534 /DNA_ID=CAMNT_0010379133 /DNA_START=39 /DNA_END=1643 /DNA_ORIENTATION=-
MDPKMFEDMGPVGSGKDGRNPPDWKGWDHMKQWEEKKEGPRPKRPPYKDPYYPQSYQLDFELDLYDKDKVKAGLMEYLGYTKGQEKIFEKHLTMIDDKIVRQYMKEAYGPGPAKGKRPFNMCIYGASGYTGMLILEYIGKRIKKDQAFTFCLAGRTLANVEAKKKEVLGRYPLDWEWDPPTYAADLNKPDDLLRLVTCCDLIINCAGPFMTTGGEKLVEACLAYNTDYVDVNGEVPFTHRLLEYHDYAKSAGVLVVPNAAAAGGMPETLTWFTAQVAKQKTGEGLRAAKCYISGSSKAMPSGGTLATRAAMNAAMKDVGMLMANPFALGGNHLGIVRPEDLDKNFSVVKYDADYGCWCGPFIYSFMETRVVRRANGLMKELTGEAYGREFSFTEQAKFPNEDSAKERQSASSNTKSEVEMLKAEGKLKALGEGAMEDERAGSWTKYEIIGKTENNKKVFTRMIGTDGYEETAHVVVDLAIVILNHRKELQFQGGVLTPGVCGQMFLVEQFRKTGFVIEEMDKVDGVEHILEDHA